MLKTNLDEQLRQWRVARLGSPSSSVVKAGQRTVRVRGSDVIVITRPTRRSANDRAGHGS